MAGVFSRLFNMGKAGVNETMDAMEKGHEYELAKVDLDELRKDEARTLEAEGTVRGAILTLQREQEHASGEAQKFEQQAMSLLGSDPEDSQGLAQRNAARAEELEGNAAALQVQIGEQKKLLEEAVSRREEIQAAVKTAENDLKLMNSMASVRKSTEKAVRGLPGRSNAMERLQERKKKMQQEMDVTRAMSEVQKEVSGDALQKQTEAALGVRPGADKMAALRAKMAKKSDETTA